MVKRPYVRPHILCTQLVICLLSHFIHTLYLGWPWSELAHILPISRMVDFCESYSPFHVCLTIRPSAHLVYATSLLLDFIHIWYLGWPWSEHVHIIPISRMVDFCESYSPFHICLTICPFTNMNKIQQKTSCIHKMCGWTYGQTNMKRAITLAKINHPWNR
jgi:hypothetical protein